MSLFHPWALAAVAACSVALVAGPVSAWTRRYVRQPLRDYNDDSVDSDTSDDAGREDDQAHAGDDIISASYTSEAEADDVTAGTASIIDAGTSRAIAVGTRTRQTRRGQDQRPSPATQSTYPTYPTLRRPALLAVIPQSLLALALCGFCVWWGMTVDALGATLVAVPVYAMLGSAASVDAVSHLLPNRLLSEYGINATLINPRYLSGVDEALLEGLKTGHRVVATLEDGSIDGGFGERIARFYGPSDMKVLNFGVKKALYDRYDVQQLMADNRLTDAQIVEDILSIV